MVACKSQISDCESVSCGGCELNAHINCKCKEEKKIPVTELWCLMNQRSRVGEKGSLQLGDFDKDELERMEMTMMRRKEKETNNTVTEDQTVETPVDDLDEFLATHDDNDDDDDDFSCKTVPGRKKCHTE